MFQVSQAPLITEVEEVHEVDGDGEGNSKPRRWSQVRQLALLLNIIFLVFWWEGWFHEAGHGPWSVMIKRYDQQAWLPGQCHRSRTFLGWSDLADTCIIVFVFFAVDMNSSIFPKLVKLKFTKEQLELRVIWFTSNKHIDNRWDSGLRYLKIVKGRC